jgi:hypothetical protein
LEKSSPFFPLLEPEDRETESSLEMLDALEEPSNSGYSWIRTDFFVFGVSAIFAIFLERLALTSSCFLFNCELGLAALVIFIVLGVYFI